MKQITVSRLVTSILIPLCFSCSKDDAVPIPSKAFTLYNYSSGSGQPAGIFTLQKLEDGNASLSIQLNDNFRVPGVILNAYLTTADTSNLIYATLGNVDGTSGAGSVSPLKTDGNNQAVNYDTLAARKGYTVKILNSSNVQARGSIE